MCDMFRERATTSCSVELPSYANLSAFAILALMPAKRRSVEVVAVPAVEEAAAAPAVTDWAVAPIPSSEAPTAVLAPSLAVDDEPEDAPVGLAVQLPAPREGDVLDADEPSADDDDSEGVDLDVAPEQAPVVAQRIARAPDGTQRYGEAVVRQLLGARFIREEPHASPTRFG